jgi:hypothetical protein
MDIDPCCQARRPSDQVSTKAGEDHSVRFGELGVGPSDGYIKLSGLSA